MSELLDKLLGPEVPDLRKDLPTKKVKIKRLSELTKQNWVVTLRALPYGRVEDIKGAGGDTDIPIVLAGMVGPDPKDEALLKRFDAVTPAEALKALLLPGEIADLALEIERLTGYRQRTIDDVKNASGAETTTN